MIDLLELEALVLEVLLVVSLVAIIVRRLKIPYTVALVLAGLVLSFRSRLELELTPELILSILLPPLVFEAAFHIQLDSLRQNLRTILLLAIPGVIVSTLVVGGVLALGAGLPLTLAIVFGALIAATDPVSVVAIFRKLGAPKRLELMLESESLFNDGTAIVVFGLAVQALLFGEFNLLEGAVDFAVIGGGGVAVGLISGWAALQLIGRIDDYLVETTLTTVLAYGSFLLAEQLHVSGVLAVVTAGLVNGNLGRREMSPTTRIVVLNFWEYVAFLANSAVFLLIGLDIDLPALAADWQPILWAIAAVLVARAIGIYGLSRLGHDMPSSWRHVMFWGGMRGAIALALALSLPVEIGEPRTTLIVMAFGVVLFTLLVQGLSMDWLVRRLRLVTRTEARLEYEMRHARALAAQSGFEHMQRLYRDGLFSRHSWERVRPVLRDRVEVLAQAVQETLKRAPELEAEELVTARREELRAQRGMLTDLSRDGVISEETHDKLGAEIDAALELTYETWPAGVYDFGETADVDHLLVVIVQDRDLEAVSNAMALRNLPTTRIESSGGFLRQRNHTLLVGVREGQVEAAVKGLSNSSQGRVEFSSALPGTESVPLPEPRQTKIHGATVFVFPVERFEAI